MSSNHDSSGEPASELEHPRGAGRAEATGSTTAASPRPPRLRARGSSRNIVVAALVAGAGFLLVDVMGRSIVEPATVWETPKHIAALLIGERAIATDPSSLGGILALALLLHGMLSLVYGMLLISATRRLRPVAAMVAGALLGVALYVVNYHVMTEVFTSFAALRGMVALVAHVVFGLTVTVVYGALERRSATVERARAGGGGHAGASVRA